MPSLPPSFLMKHAEMLGIGTLYKQVSGPRVSVVGISRQCLPVLSLQGGLFSLKCLFLVGSVCSFYTAKRCHSLPRMPSLLIISIPEFMYL